MNVAAVGPAAAVVTVSAQVVLLDVVHRLRGTGSGRSKGWGGDFMDKLALGWTKAALVPMSARLVEAVVATTATTTAMGVATTSTAIAGLGARITAAVLATLMHRSLLTPVWWVRGVAREK